MKNDMNALKHENDIMKENIDKISRHVFPLEKTIGFMEYPTYGRNDSKRKSSLKVDDYGIDIDQIIKDYKTGKASKIPQEENEKKASKAMFQDQCDKNNVHASQERYSLKRYRNASNLTTETEDTDSSDADDRHNGRTSLRKKDLRFSIQKKDASQHLCSLSRDQYFNTETIHMYAVSMAYLCATQPSPWKRTWSWMAAVIGFLTIFAQMTITLSLISEASSPTCAMHDECQRGMFCDGFNFYSTSRNPRCLDCVMIGDYGDECGNHPEDEHEITVGQWIQLAENMWFEKDFTPHVDTESTFLSVDVSGVDIDFFTKCATAQYCKDSEVADDIADDVCPHLGINMAQFSNAKKFVFVLICILFGSNMLIDIKESNIERKILHHVEDNLQDGQSMPSSVLLIQINLIFRRYMLPIVTFGAGISVSLTQQLSAQNIVLNLIAVLFINEADNLLGAILLSSQQHMIGDNLVLSANLQKPQDYGTYNASRSYAIFLSIAMSIVCLQVESIAKIFGGNVQCDSLKHALLNFGVGVIVQVVILVRTFQKWICRPQHSHTTPCVFLEFFRMYIAFYCGFIFIGLEYAFDWTDALMRYPPLPICVGLVSSIVATMRTEYVLKHPRTSTVWYRGMDCLLGVLWLVCQIWVIPILMGFHIFNAP